MHAIVQHQFGGPEVMQYEELPDPTAGARQVRIVVEASGVHLVDTMIRQGTSLGAMQTPELPMTPGREVAGIVDAIGTDVDKSWLGGHVVAHLGAANGGYASLAVADERALIAFPPHVDAADAVAMVGTGRTALAILDIAAVHAGDVALVTAAAGGIGSLLVQALRAEGAFVSGAAGTDDKAHIAKTRGADVGVTYATSTWPQSVRSALDGRVVTLALDGVGGAIGRAAFELVAPGGRMILYGTASGTPLPLSADDLFERGVTVSAAIGARLMSRPGALEQYARRALDELAAGRLTPIIQPFSLAEAAAAHRALGARDTTGKVVLYP
jgi:NADPH2:quinone reductase